MRCGGRVGSSKWQALCRNLSAHPWDGEGLSWAGHRHPHIPVSSRTWLWLNPHLCDLPGCNFVSGFR